MSGIQSGKARRKAYIVARVGKHQLAARTSATSLRETLILDKSPIKRAKMAHRKKS